MDLSLLQKLVEDLERMFPNSLPLFSDINDKGLLEVARRAGQQEVIRMLRGQFYDLQNRSQEGVISL